MRALSVVGAAAFSAAAGLSLSGCDQIAEQCQLTCPDEGILEGNASISGVPSIDSFFAATIDVRDATLDLENSLRLELLGLASALKIKNPSNDLGTLANQVQNALKVQFQAKLEGGIRVGYAPPRCEADFGVAVQASANCDVDVKPGEVELSCQGSCAIDASLEAQAACSASGTLRCEVNAPGVECKGSCTGTCQLEAAAQCEGSCQGSCEGSCSACTGGECKTDASGKITNCAGTCTGSCSGSCEMTAGGSCNGNCEGSCEFTPPSGQCEADAVVRCQAKAEAKMNVQCNGKCEGNITPPEIKAECQASIDAQARANLQCKPPHLEIDYAFKANIGPEGKAEFRALLNVLRLRFSNMLALDSKSARVTVAAQNLSQNATNVLEDAKARIEAGVKLKNAIDLTCAVSEGANVAKLMGSSTASLKASISAVGVVSATMNTYTFER